MLNSLGILAIIVICGFFITFSIIAFFVMCIVGCTQKRKQSQRPRHANRRQPTDMESQDLPSEQDNNDEENGEGCKTRDLSQTPPPAYRNANQYQNVDLEHTEVVQIKEAYYYRVSFHCKSTEITSLPPDYTSQRLSISIAPQEIEAPEGQLPPTYSTAQLELMARRTATE